MTNTPNQGMELLACPFCGGEVCISPARVQGEADCISHLPIVGGHRCGIDEFSNFAYDDDVAALWNTRTTPTPASSGVLVEAAKAVLEHRVGEQPTRGYLRDNDASRVALSQLAQALSSASTDTGAREPVAWRWEGRGRAGNWQRNLTTFCPQEGDANYVRNVEPLYLDPTPNTDTPDRFGGWYRAGVEGDLAWFSSQRHLSLKFYSPVYGDDDDQNYEWRVHKESGSINDREWEVVGRGTDAAEAIAAARTAIRALSPQPLGTAKERGE